MDPFQVLLAFYNIQVAMDINSLFIEKNRGGGAFQGPCVCSLLVMHHSLLLIELPSILRTAVYLFMFVIIFAFLDTEIPSNHKRIC